ncbi:MAG TPA: endonuclease [Candidatus Cloacimonadota bacterium]|nr:endonuclease [Candidatus Cloacimonadota bacterium]
MPKYALLTAVLLMLAGILSAQYIVGFEGAGETKLAYASGNVTLNWISWNLTEVLIGTDTADWKNGARSARLRGYGTSSMTMLADKTGGIGAITFQYRRYGTDTQVDWKVEYSVNGGSSWIQTGPSFTASSSDMPQSFSSTLNLNGNVRIRIKRATESGTTNLRLNIDDITLTDYAVAPATLTLAPTSLTGFTYVQEEGPSDPQTYTISGQNLSPASGNISIAGAAAFEFSSTGSSYSSSLLVPYNDSQFGATVYVRMISGLSAGSYNQSATHTGGGAEAQLLGLSGTVNEPAVYATDLLISEYIEGSSNNKAIEIFNGTGAPVDLSNYKLETYFNGNSTPTSTFTLNGILAPMDVFVIVNSGSNPNILAVADTTNNGVINYNGNDAIALKKISTEAFVDIFGVIGNDPGTAWTADGGYSTQDRTLVRKPTVISGVTQNPVGTGATAFTTLDTEWDLYPIDTFSDLGTHSFGGGGQSVCTPTIQASNIVAYPSNDEIALEWTAGNGNRRIVKINASNSFTAPADGTQPTANPVYSGSGEQVIFDGATQIIEGTPFNGCLVSGLQPNTTYWFRIYEYNGTGITTRFLTITAPDNPSPATTSNTTGIGYYAGISGYGSSIKSSLHALLRTTHTTQYSYDALWTQLPYTDEDPANTNNVIELYTGWSVPKNHYGGGITEWNREHTWSKSHGDFGDNRPAGTDLHHMRPCDATVNSAKNNRDFDEGGTAYTDASPYPGYSGVTGCYTSSNTWEPRNEDKGDVARMIMYMAVRYEGTDTSYDLEIVDYTNTSPSGEPYYGKLSTLLNWHVQDPPDARERQRNDRIFERQGNRNPFIDYPSYAQYIWSPVPTGPTSLTQTGFTANWSTPISATKYYLQVATDSLFSSFVSGYTNYDAALSNAKTISGLSNMNTYYYRLRSYFLSGYSMYSPWVAVNLLPNGTALIAAQSSVYEYDLQGAQLQLNLQNASFSDPSLNLANFTLLNGPAGLSIQSVQYLSSNSARLVLAFNGSDFDDNRQISILISPSELTQSTAITSSSLQLIAYVETLLSIDLQSGSLVLNIVPVSQASSYRIFGAADPYDDFINISAQGSFEVLVPTRWTTPSPTAPRAFYKAVGIRD